jgi:hypothetical protein
MLQTPVVNQLTVITNKPPRPMKDLFPGAPYIRPHTLVLFIPSPPSLSLLVQHSRFHIVDLVAQDDDTPALGVRVHGSNALVSIIAAKSSGRYRVQSDDFAALATPLTSLMRALEDHYE